MSHHFEGATAVVTGAASGIGQALGEELASRGCEVVLADRQIGLAQEVASAIRGSGGRATAAHLDVTDFPAVERLIQGTLQRTGRLDFLFNNAGIGIGGNVIHFDIDSWNRTIDVNLRGVVNGVQAAYPLMRERKSGHIINTASMAGLMPSPGAVPYAATKSAVVGLSIALRGEAASAGVRVSVICPGVIRTPILDGGGKYGGMLIDVPQEKMRQLWEKARPMDPDLFAHKVLRAVARDRAIIIAPAWWKGFWWLNRLSPSLGMRLARRNFEKVQQELGIRD